MGLAVGVAVASLGGCVPDARPDPCGPCPDSCGDDGCVPVRLAELEGPIQDLDAVAGQVFACVGEAHAAHLDAVDADGLVVGRGEVVECGEVHASAALGFAFLDDSGARIARVALDAGAQQDVVQGLGIASFDVCGDQLAYMSSVELTVEQSPAAGGPSTLVDPPLGPDVAWVRCSPSGRIAYALPELESVMTWSPGDAEPTLVFNAQRAETQAPSLEGLAFAGERLFVVRAGQLLLVDASRPRPPLVVHEGLVGPIRLRGRGRWVAIADAGRGTVVLVDVEARQAEEIAHDLTEPRVALDDSALYFGDALGALTRVALPVR